eukprot:7340288-Ditylum_brightwellii.AAC.1
MGNLVAEWGNSSNGHATYTPSVLQDVNKCKEDLKEKTLEPSEHQKSLFHTLINSLVDGIQGGDYFFQGPVLKPLQSLFNKMFIQHVQTTVSVIGDMTRATLLIDNKEDLIRVVSRIREMFPNIHGNNFKGPGKIGVNKFVHQVLKMKKVPDTEIIPY